MYDLIWILIGIISLILFAFAIDYLKFLFIMKAAKSKKIKRGTKEDFGLYLYYLQYAKVMPTLKPFLKDTLKVVLDSVVIVFLLDSFLRQDWLLFLYLIILRLLFYVGFEGSKIDRKAFYRAIENDIKTYKKVEKH